MVVCLTKADDLCPNPEPETCTICERRAHYPFLCWHGSKLIICRECCREVKRGLIADLLHLGAIADLHALGYYYETLARETKDYHEQRVLEFQARMKKRL
jgi:hypothetical protein